MSRSARKADPVRDQLRAAIAGILDQSPAADTLDLVTEAETLDVSYVASDFGFQVARWEWVTEDVALVTRPAGAAPLRRYTLTLDWTGSSP